MTLNSTIIGLFDEQVAAAPDAICISDENRRLTWRRFSALIDAIGERIPSDAKRVGVVMNHSVEMVAALFAILKQGCAYVPAEPTFPNERIAFMMKDAHVDAVLVDDGFEANRGAADRAGEEGQPPTITIERGLEATGAPSENRARPQDTAYILYTSGSTGAPKGVSVRNENVCHYIRAFQHEFKPTSDDIMLQYSVCSFDIFVEEVFAALCSGAALAIPSAEERHDIPSLMDFVERQNVTIISGFPYLLMEMNALPRIPASLRLLISGGDVLRGSYVDNLLDQAEVYNTYGPSETTVCATYFRCNGAQPLPDGTYPVGRAVRGASIAILDENLTPVAPGQVGEICISGSGVSSGYVGERKKENEAFVARESEGVLYRSGDMGYTLPDGNIAFLHRKDTQVMILGKRVEPTEVESVLCDCPEVKAACVRPSADEAGLSYLIAYIVTSHGRAHLSALKSEMARFLPAYMIPEFFVQLTEMPLTDNGKIDTAALPVVLKEGDIA